MAPLPADYKQTEEKSFKGTESGRNVLESNAKAQTTVPSTQIEGQPGDGPPLPPINIGKQRSASNRNNKFSTPLRYPYSEIHSTTDYLQIEILKYKTLGITPQANVLQKGVNSNKRNYNNTKKEDAIGTIFLPIPQNISSTNSTGCLLYTSPSPRD